MPTKLDLDFMKAQEDGTDTTSIVEQSKNTLRKHLVPEQVDTASTVDEIKAV